MKKGFTLVEVLVAVMFLSLGMGVLLTSISHCLAVVRRAQEYENARWILGLGEAEHPPTSPKNPEDLVVEPVEYENGYRYAREVEEDEDQDELFVVRDRVTWPCRGGEKGEEVVRYVFVPGASSRAGTARSGRLTPATPPASRLPDAAGLPPEGTTP